MPLQVVMNLVTVEWKIYKSAIQKCNDNVQLATLLPHIHLLVSASVNALGYELVCCLKTIAIDFSRRGYL